MTAYTQAPPRRGAAGFTLTELLVGMAIFITLLSGVVVLFNGAVSTAQQGYQAGDNFTLARGSLRVLERDLTTSFAAQEFGEIFQFYGNEDGFMFVGLIDGVPTRVTYVLHPTAQTDLFRTEFSESYDVLANQVWTQALQPDGTRDGRPLELAEYLLQLDELDAFGPAGQVWNPTVLADTAPQNLPGYIAEQIVTIPVVVETHALLRYAEPGQGDLDNLTPPRGFNRWPRLDLIDPANDPVANGVESALAPLYQEMVSRLRSQGQPGNVAFDIRRLIADLRAAGQIRAFTPQRVESMIRTAKREIWLEMLAEGEVVRDPPGLSIWQPGGLIPGTSRSADPADYQVAENFVFSVTPVGGPEFNCIQEPSFFYSEGPDTQGLRTFNGLENIAGYAPFRAANSRADAEFAVQQMDEQLSGTLRRVAQGSAFASPFAPRLPAVVTPTFWLMDRSPWVGAADFRRLFTQGIPIPAGTERRLPTALALPEKSG